METWHFPSRFHPLIFPSSLPLKQGVLTRYFQCWCWRSKRNWLALLTDSLFGTVNGTTGEGLSLSVSERRQVAEEWVTRGRNK